MMKVYCSKNQYSVGLVIWMKWHKDVQINPTRCCIVNVVNITERWTICEEFVDHMVQLRANDKTEYSLILNKKSKVKNLILDWNKHFIFLFIFVIMNFPPFPFLSYHSPPFHQNRERTKVGRQETNFEGLNGSTPDFKHPVSGVKSNYKDYVYNSYNGHPNITSKSVDQILKSKWSGTNPLYRVWSDQIDVRYKLIEVLDTSHETQ